MARQVTLIPGDAIGPEVAEATVRAIEATGVAIEWERVQAGVRFENAIYEVYAEARHLTGDVGGGASTTEFTDAVIRRVG